MALHTYPKWVQKLDQPGVCLDGTLFLLLGKEWEPYGYFDRWLRTEKHNHWFIIRVSFGHRWHQVGGSQSATQNCGVINCSLLFRSWPYCLEAHHRPWNISEMRYCYQCLQVVALMSYLCAYVDIWRSMVSTLCWHVCFLSFFFFFFFLSRKSNICGLT